MTDTAVAEAFTSELHPHAASGPGGGQFVSTAGASGKATAKKTAAGGVPAGSMSFNRKKNRGTGYGLRGGDKRVRALQTILNRLGIPDAHGRPLAVDGRLGPKTTTAIVHLQQRLGVKADGIVTPAFLAQIRNLRAVPMPKKAGKAAKKTARAREAIPASVWWDIDPVGVLDEATEALIAALDRIAPNRTTEARLSGEEFNSVHRRGSDGKFIKMIDRIIGALYEHEKNGGEGGDPLAEFNRTQLRNAAKSRGITLTRGESDDSIKAKLIANIRGDNGGGPDKPQPASPAKAAKKAAPKKAPVKKPAAARGVEKPGKGNTLSASSRVLRGGDWDKHPATPAGVRAAYADIVRERSKKQGLDSWVGLADLRERMGGTRAEQDAALHSLRRMDGVRIIPVADLKNLKPRDRDSALRIGGEDNHAIAIGAPDVSAQSELDAAVARYERDYGPDRAEWPASAQAAILGLEARGAVQTTRHPATAEGIAAAIHEISARPGEWVSMAELRRKLGGSRAEQDQAITDAARDRLIRAHPEENQQTLTAADRTAAVVIGGEPKHMVQILRNQAQRTPAMPSGGSRLQAAGRAIAVPPKARFGDPVTAGHPLADVLRTAPSREAGHAAIAGLDKRQLTELADSLNVAYGKSYNKQRLRDAIVSQIVGGRLTADAILQSRPAR